jgi:DNA modification methylase
MGSLLEKFAGKIDLIYIDPPFATGADFSFKTQIGEGGLEVIKEQSIIEEKAYRDTWGRGLDSFIHMLSDRFHLMRDLLADDGSIYVHIGWNVSHYVKAALDEVFGPDRFVNQVIWKRQSAHSDVAQGATHFGRVHDVILFYTRGMGPTWNQQYEPYDEEYIETHYRHFQPETGKRFTHSDLTAAKPGGDTQYEWRVKRRSNDVTWQADLTDEYLHPVVGIEYKGVRPYRGRYWGYSKANMADFEKQGRIYYTNTGTPRLKNYLEDMQGRSIQDLWDKMSTQAMGVERTGYPTQKPEVLLERIISTSSTSDSLVVDFFCGSGTTLSVAEKLGRRWIGCDLSRFAIHVTRKRLLGIEGCQPFEILNLGKYERQYWQGMTFGEQGTHITEQALYEYLAFLLKLYGAQPVPGLTHIHGKKGKAMVHIGAVDAPVTIDEISTAIAECVQLRQTELHVLGWEWEMGLYDLMIPEAKTRGVKLLLLQIPREVMEQQAVDKGDIQFFELAYLEVDIKTVWELTARVTLLDFVIPNTELIPEEVRSKVKKWSDYIDYWAVDWDFQDDTFMQGWVTYRTRKDRTLALTSDPHTYEAPGRYRVFVKVVDIFGNDTSQVFAVEVK